MKLTKSVFIAFLILLNFGFAKAATIQGTLVDSKTGEPLLGANVMIKGTSLGTATNLEGKYVISRVPPGQHVIRFMYIGYEEGERTVRVILPDQTVIQNAELRVSVVEGELVTVSAQAQGQLAAINQQLNADQMVNMVDAARIQEVPDQNAAESIARLPGVMITRNNGEGAGVGIRGLAPQYNQVQLDGVIMGSSPGMGRVEDFGHGRGVNLSSIAQENLSGIELYKTITPDMDAATLGGTVNLRLGKASEDPIYQVRLYGAYNQQEEVIDQFNDFQQYRWMARLSRRFFSNKLGVQLSVNSEKRNRGSDRLSANISKEDIYQPDGSRVTRFPTESATIRDIRTIRYKHSANAILDYNLFGSEVLLSNFYNWGTYRSMEVKRTTGDIYGYETDSKNYSLSNALRVKHKLPLFEVEWQLSRYSTKTETPDDYEVRIGQLQQSSLPPDVEQLDPEDWLLALPNDGIWKFTRTERDSAWIGETQYSGKLDIKHPFYFNKISGFLKFGGMYKRISRESYIYHQSLHNGRFPDGAEGPDISYFDTDYNDDPVLNGNTAIRKYINVNVISNLWTDWIKNWHMADPQILDTPNDNYNILENYYAGYLMLKANAFNNLLTLIPGVRYEGSDFDANGYYHWTTSRSTTTFQGEYNAQNAKRSERFWLPMVHIKVKPTDWFDTRLSATKTISRPNFQYRIPYTTVSFNPENATQLGNPDLKTASSWNFDWSNSFYHSNFGLFTISGFYKEIQNFSFRFDDFIANNEDAIAFGFDPEDPAFDRGHYTGKEVRTWANTHGISTVRGFEIDYQANLHKLPSLLKHITFSINYTRAWSNSWLRQYSVTLDSIEYVSYDPYIIEHNTYHTGFRRGRLLTQPDHILNMSIGYDIGGFSGRFSTFFQGRSLRGNARVEPNDRYVEDFLRYDFSLRYRVNNHFSFLASGVNITKTPDIASLSGTHKHSSYDIYGAMYDFGIQYDF